MSDNLPVRSERREVIPIHRELTPSGRVRPIKHVRKYKSGKRALVNPEIQPKYRIVNRNTAVESKSSGLVPKVKLPLPMRWQNTFTGDTIKARPISSPILHTFDELRQRVIDAMDEDGYSYPSRNEEEFFVDWVDDPVKQLLEEIEEKTVAEDWMKEESLSEKIKEIAKEAVNVLQDDEFEHDATIIHGNSDDPDDYYSRGHISTYFKDDGADGIDIKWRNLGGYNGCYDAVLDPKEWEELLQDESLSGSESNKYLEDFDEALTKELNARGIKNAKIVMRSSNLFWNPITYIVEAGKAAEVKALMHNLKNILRHEEVHQAELNPLHSGVKAALGKGLNKDQIRKLLSEHIKSDELRKMLEDALNDESSS